MLSPAPCTSEGRLGSDCFNAGVIGIADHLEFLHPRRDQTVAAKLDFTLRHSVIPDLCVFVPTDEARFVAWPHIEFSHIRWRFSPKVLEKSLAIAYAFVVPAHERIPLLSLGLKFLEASHIKDLLAVLRFAQNPRGRMAGFRVLQQIPGIGPATATRLLELISEAPEPTVAVENFEVNANVAEDWQSFVQLYRALTLPQRTWPADMELAMRWYPPFERIFG